MNLPAGIVPRCDADTAKPVDPEWAAMTAWTDDPLLPLGVLVGAFLVIAGLGTVVTAPWQYYGSTIVTVLRILGTVGTILIGVGLIYVAWGATWLAERRA